MATVTGSSRGRRAGEPRVTPPSVVTAGTGGSSALSGAGFRCFVSDHEGVDEELARSLSEIEVKIDGAGVATTVQVCAHHRAQLDELREERKTELRQAAEAPYGHCHVCKRAVGIPVPGREYDRGATLTWWQHMDSPDVVHCEGCVCTATNPENDGPVGTQRLTLVFGEKR